MSQNDKSRDNQHERRAKEILRRSSKWVCVYPGCDEKSIYSHAVSESISLSTISENGHLLTIKSQRKGDLKELSFGKISMHDASAFNGFCNQHDDIFRSLDTQEIQDARSLMLQAYRTVVSESVDESRLGILHADGYESVDLDNFLNSVDVAEFPEVKDEGFRQWFKAEYTKIISSAVRRTDDVLKLPKQILEKVDIFGLQSLDGNSVVTTEQLSHYIPYRRLSVQLPVAVNCMIHAAGGGEFRDFFFAVIPYADSTFVFGVVPKACQQSLLDKIMEGFSSDPGLIDLVESVLVGSNEWYMRPSVLDGMSSEKREVFLHDCTFFNEHRLYEQYDMVLLEDARRTLAQKKPELVHALRLDRTQYVPIRDGYNVRHQRMIAQMCAQPFKLREL
ncbi:hypothetical protein [Pseudomonas aeruginosa]|uniref:hypothetical protein n=2 Tax=Pseudomonas aeruginosa TaxID=287 RepID=UPI00114F57D7|nr:hypothetical protein [Pseudomonas aeruginosa]TQG18877.1 hypothetical protein FLI78_02850 [Pseudomonas aeruginosa]